MRNLKPVETTAPMQHDDRRAAIYTGHGEGHAASIQKHSCDRAFAVFAIVMVAHGNEGKRLIWTATRHGKPIISGYRHDAVLNAAIGLLTGA